MIDCLQNKHCYIMQMSADKKRQMATDNLCQSAEEICANLCNNYQSSILIDKTL